MRSPLRTTFRNPTTNDLMKTFGLVKALVLIGVFVICGLAQVETRPSTPRVGPREEPTVTVTDMLAKQRLEAERKRYQEMMKRSEEAEKLSNEIFEEFDAEKKMSPATERKIAQLEKLVQRIRKDLGGGSDGKSDAGKTEAMSAADAFGILRRHTHRLISELKRSSRYTVSGAAIESSNIILRTVRLLRLSK